MKKRTLLVVDDESDMELLIRQKFRKPIASGEMFFHFASNGRMALEILENQSDIEVIMTDINMPVMTGLELLDHLHKMPSPPLCIVASAYNDIENIRTAMNRGAFDFITKPIDFKDLEITLEKTIAAADEKKEAAMALIERDRALRESEHAKASERFKQQFLANMSHEIRTPMNSVIGITHLLLKTRLNEQQHRYVTMVRSASEQLMTIINDILDLSKIEAGKMVFEKIAFSPREVMDNVKNMLFTKAEEKTLELRTRCSDRVPDRVLGDPSRLAQILINLTGNAIKFTHEGLVEINIENKSESIEYIILEFNVTDTGIGIPNDKLSSIFESFTQAENDTSRKYGGTGLGLTISKQLTELQGGKIGLESAYGKGTRFYFSIPYSPVMETVSNNDQNGQISPMDAISIQLNAMRVLLVEDNDFNKVVAEDTLKEFAPGITIDHASTGVEAVEMVQVTSYDLVLMDIQMPEMDGYEATVRIRQLNSPLNQIPVMAMTANATTEEVQKCFDSGMNDYISKPFIPDELFRKMAALGVKSASPQSQR